MKPWGAPEIVKLQATGKSIFARKI